MINIQKKAEKNQWTMSKVERTTLGCVFHLIIHLEQNQGGGGVYTEYSFITVFA